MEAPEQSSALVESLYAISVEPERLLDLVREWNERIEADPLRALATCTEAEPVFARHVERALAILDEINAFEFGRLDDLLAGMAAPAMVLSERGVVVAANEAARSVFGLPPGSLIANMRLAEPELGTLAERLAAVAGEGGRGEDVIRLDRSEQDGALWLVLRRLDTDRRQRHVLAVSAEHPWHEDAGCALGAVFSMTGAETALVRRLAEGETVRSVARRSGRSEGTIRSQLHSILSKTGARTQAELARVIVALLQAVSFDVRRVAPPRHGGVPGRRASPHVRLADGRRLAVRHYGDPQGRPVLWLQSAIGFFEPTAEGERALVHRGLRLVVPIRAGYATSDPLPPDRDVLEAAIDDIAEVCRQTGLARCPVVAHFYDIRLALALAHRAPEAVERIVGISCMFPIENLAQFRRLNAISRFYVATIRYTPYLLPFIVRAWHADMRRNGLAAAIRQVYRGHLADERAFARPDIAAAMTGAYGLIYESGAPARAAFCAEAIRYAEPWPAGFGSVDCPVTFIHGVQDGHGLHETLLDYRAAYHGWEVVAFPDEGQLVGFVHWSAVLDAIEGGASRPDGTIPVPAASATTQPTKGSSRTMKSASDSVGAP